MKVYSPVVSQVVPVGFAELAQAADGLPGQELTQDQARLKVHDLIGPGLAGAIRYGGTLRTTPALLHTVKVEVVVSPWSAGRSEVAIHPITNLGHLDSGRANRFYQAARTDTPRADRSPQRRTSCRGPRRPQGGSLGRLPQTSTDSLYLVALPLGATGRSHTPQCGPR